MTIASAFRNQDVFDNTHPNYAGEVGIAMNPKLAARVREADLLLVIGERLGEMVTNGYTLLRAPLRAHALIHVHPDATELGRLYHPALGIQASMPAMAAALAAMPPVSTPVWRNTAAEAHGDYDAWQMPRPMVGTLDLWRVVSALREQLPDDAIVTNGAGNYTVWMHRLFRYRGYRIQLALRNGAMGCGVPAAVAAKLVHPERVVVMEWRWLLPR
jgi:acetolactate synthase-1/2/3 large subunit